MRSPAGLRHAGRRSLAPCVRACVAIVAVVWTVGSVLPPTKVEAQTAAAPLTIWSFLGVPNPLAMNATAQQSANPAIQAAAKAKAAKHEIPKKKAALRYLAGIGCTPEHPEVMPALMAAMDDPDEQVRYEAVKAVLETSEVCQSRDQKKAVRKAKGMCESCADWKRNCEKKVCEAVERLCGKAPPKEHKHHLKQAMKKAFGDECEDLAKEDCPCAERRGSCCGPEMRDKLMKIAFGRDDLGCFLEPSKRVRDLAELALDACNACACGCEGVTDGDTAAMDHVVREMPPVDADKETQPSDTAPLPLGAPCFDDRLVEPPSPAHREQLPMPVPALEPEMIPAPPPSAAIPAPVSVLVQSPAGAVPGPLATTDAEESPTQPEPADPLADASGNREPTDESQQALPATHIKVFRDAGDASTVMEEPPGAEIPPNPLRTPRRLRRASDFHPVASPQTAARAPLHRPSVEARPSPADSSQLPTKSLERSRTEAGFSRRNWSFAPFDEDSTGAHAAPGHDTP